MKLAEIAARINAHLKRIETDPKLNPWDRGKVGGTKPYYCSSACAAGRYVLVVYIVYQGYSALTKDAALAYLAWLDAGNVGRHYEQQREAKETSK